MSIDEPCDFCGQDDWDRKHCDTCGKVFCTICEPNRNDDAPVNLCEDCVSHVSIDDEHEAEGK